MNNLFGYDSRTQGGVVYHTITSDTNIPIALAVLK